MKTEDEIIRAEFEKYLYDYHQLTCYGFMFNRLNSGKYRSHNIEREWQVWQASQQLNDEVIAAKDARVEELEAHMKELACKLFYECIPANLAKDAEIAKLREAFKEAIKGLRKFEYIYEGEHGFVYHNEQSAIDKFNELLHEE